ncbi:CAP domain-containing protein [Sporosarcina sp. YIM B06819]|uniref:CAP and S-layer homology domain-containing protein n=1 Tax=Sporosarcina sp. YIM B06819 TaxID=3081769 RepID=UPI00298C6E95|nr:CAP domain-containing protein [Sporosarcina sp. YIM B06819]
MPKNLIRSFAIAAVFTGGFLAVDAVQEPHAVHASSTQIDGYTYSAEVVEAFNEINKYRTSVGLEPYKIDPFLSKSAESHAKYLVTHVKTASHDQTSGKSGFTGITYRDRAKSAGYTISSGTEGVTYGTSMTVKKGISNFVEGIHHREVVLSSSYDTVGIGIDGGAIVVVTDNSDGVGNKAVSYPYNGQKDAPTLFSIKEDPDPLKKYGVKTSGYMISYNPRKAISWFTEGVMTLKDSKGAIVPTHNKNNVPDTSGNIMYLVPKAELKKGEKYTVAVTYYDINETKDSYSWSFTTEGTATQTPPKPPVTTATDYSKYSKQFADFDPKAWWAADMVWAVERGYISGYSNVLNPKTKKHETHLKPGNQLTEAHFLMIMFRYMISDEYGSTKASSKWAYNVPYKIAKKYNLPTLANESSTTKQKAATQGIRRGKLAQILVSMHEGQQVTEATAINFMIKNKLTSATTVKDYNANQILTRAQVSAFLQRHEAFVASQKVRY